MNFSLTLNIDAKDLGFINDAGQKVALARPVGNSAANVIWVTFDPFESNTIQWTEEYWIYASTTSTNIKGSQIQQMSQVAPGPAITGAIYTLEPAATFSTPIPNPTIGANTFAVQNEVPYDEHPVLTLGLSQSVTVNQRNLDRIPISATAVLATQQIQMTPGNSVYIWLESDFGSSTIITDLTELADVNGKRAIAKFGDGISHIEMSYDGKIGLFHE
ncbi:hypothetical protein [Thalassospira marina]|uniref:Uncharacterized protein n=1 Tax=Thalassospira marina TaxID=2048283 RepID=A0ABN5FIZ6_9PROT|nr:hypothetical protein [Thalassospira marina]AUG54182.1 hypothetical protein CSC3H3_16730 [Thalassospira marina]